VPLTARHAIAICTGSRPALPELAGLAEARPWTNRQATDSRAVPGRLAIVGGGGVGVEMASAWHGLGTSVTLLAQADGLLPRMEPFAGELVARAFTDAGIDVRIGVTVTGVRRPGGTGPVILTLEDGGEVEADEVLFATGRQPLTGDIGLDTVGLEPGSWLEVDDTCRVRAVDDGWLYALGDINHHALLTHQGKYQARIASAAIAARAAGQPVDPAPWGAHAITADYHAVPQVFWTCRASIARPASSSHNTVVAIQPHRSPSSPERSAAVKAFTACRSAGAAAAGPSVTSRATPSRSNSTGRGESAGGGRARAARETSSRSPAPARCPASAAAIHAVR